MVYQGDLMEYIYETPHVLDQIRKKGIAVISVTGEYDTEIIRHGDAKLYVECGYEDAGATTKGYSATVLTLLLFVIMTAEKTEKITSQEADSYRNRIRTVIRNMGHVLKDSRRWCERSAEKLKSSADLIIVASSNLKSLLLEGTLKFCRRYCRSGRLMPVRITGPKYILLYIWLYMTKRPGTHAGIDSRPFFTPGSASPAGSLPYFS